MTLDISIVSDFMCPWCFIGKRWLAEAAREVAGRHELRVTWHPYQLNPDLPTEGVDRAAYFEAKFGTDTARDIYAHIGRVGRRAGIAFDFDAIERTPNTFDAHRLAWLAHQAERQEPVVESLFQAFFLRGRDIGDREVLAEVAGEAGLDPEPAARFLDGEGGTTEVRAAEKAIRRFQIRGVPTVFVNGRHAAGGAQRPEALVPLFDRVAERAETHVEERTKGSTRAQRQGDDA